MQERNEELESNRIILFVCAECGDVGCGATTFDLTENDTEIIWSNFGDENDYENSIDHSKYKNVGPFKFEKIEYKRLFNELLNTIVVYNKK